VAFIFYWFDNLGFLLRENSLLYASYLPLGVPNGRVLYRHKHAPKNSTQPDLRAMADHSGLPELSGQARTIPGIIFVLTVIQPD
jgi:hypothetical protein